MAKKAEKPLTINRPARAACKLYQAKIEATLEQGARAIATSDGATQVDVQHMEQAIHDWETRKLSRKRTSRWLVSIGGLGGFLTGVGPSLPSYAKVLFNIADDNLVVWQGIAGGVIVAGVAIAAVAAFRPET